MEQKETVIPDPEKIKFEFRSQMMHATEKCNISKLPAMLRALGVNQTDEQLKKIIVDMNPSADGWFSLEEFENLDIFKAPVEQHSLHEIVQALAVFDKDDDGIISVKELELAMMGWGLPNEDGTNSKMRFEEFQVMEKAIRDEGIIDS